MFNLVVPLKALLFQWLTLGFSNDILIFDKLLDYIKNIISLFFRYLQIDNKHNRVVYNNFVNWYHYEKFFDKLS